MPQNNPTAGAAVRTAADLMTTSPRTCSPFSTIAEAALIFRDEGCGAVPVVDEGKPVGILTDRDVALAVTRHSRLHDLPVSAVLTPGPLVTVAAADPPDAVAGAMAEGQVRRVLVVEPDGRLAGIIALSDLAPHLPAEALGRLTARIDERAEAEAGAPAPGAKPPTFPPIRPPGGRWAWARPGAFWDLIRTTAGQWSEDKVPRLGAALAFYSVLSLAPLLLIAIAVAALIFGEEAASGQLRGQIRDAVGDEGAGAIQAMLQNAHKPSSGLIATLVGSAALLFAASGLFGQLQDAMNTIWEVQPRPGRGIVGVIKDRALTFGMVLGTGFLLLTSLVLSTAVAATLNMVTNLAPGLGPLLRFGDVAVSAVVVTILFALIYKVLPDARIAWRDVWVGAGLTTALFLIGKALIGAYLGRSGYGSAYGAAGSLVVLLVWIYYSAQILFFGAEFTKVFADRYGARIEPKADAEHVPDRTRAQQGIPRGPARA